MKLRVNYEFIIAWTVILGGAVVWLIVIFGLVQYLLGIPK